MRTLLAFFCLLAIAARGAVLYPPSAGGSGTVTSVDVALAGFTSSGAVTTSGTVTLTGQGLVMTNGSWIRTVLMGGVSAALDNNSAQYSTLNGTVSSAAGSTNRAQPIPIGGYLSNFVVGWGRPIAATTNISFAVATNDLGAVVANLVDTPLTITLKGETGKVWTNTSTEVFNLPSTRNTVVTVRLTPSAALGTMSAYWSVEWWHQTP
jgi:hypothetical protein